jgi:hypothetical protein
MRSVTQRQKRADFCRNALEGQIDWARDAVISDESRFGVQEKWGLVDLHYDMGRKLTFFDRFLC